MQLRECKVGIKKVTLSRTIIRVESRGMPDFAIVIETPGGGYPMKSPDLARFQIRK